MLIFWIVNFSFFFFSCLGCACLGLFAFFCKCLRARLLESMIFECIFNLHHRVTENKIDNVQCLLATCWRALVTSSCLFIGLPFCALVTCIVLFFFFFDLIFNILDFWFYILITFLRAFNITDCYTLFCFGLFLCEYCLFSFSFIFFFTEEILYSVSFNEEGKKYSVLKITDTKTM